MNPTTPAAVAALQPPVQPESSALPGVNVMLMGPAGAGKTYSIGTLVDTGVETFVLMLESGLESLLGYWTDRGKPIPPNLHWRTVKARSSGFGAFFDSMDSVLKQSAEFLAKAEDKNRGKYDQFLQLISACKDFVSERDGKSYGDVGTWGPNRALVLDGLSGINNFAMQTVIGGKILRSQQNWQMAQSAAEGFIRLCVEGTTAHFICLAHVERETDPVLGGVKLMPSTLGKALAPKLPAMFSDVILAVKNGSAFTWDTSNPQADLKTRNLTIAANLPANFATILDKWKSRGGRFSTVIDAKNIHGLDQSSATAN